MPSRVITFRFRAVDSIRVAPGSIVSGGTFFRGGRPPSPERITKQAEAAAIRWLLRSLPARELLFEELGLVPDTYVHVEVVKPIFDRGRRSRPGDIDLLFVPTAGEPIAIQAKRIAVTATSAEEDRTNRHALGNITDLVDQANKMRELGFHRNYLMLIIEVDGVARDTYNFVARGPTQERFQRIYDVTWNEPIHNDVGVVYVEIIQPTEASYRDAYVVGVCVDRPAGIQEQPAALTAKVLELVRSCPSA